MASYVAVAAAGSLNVLFTRASEISGGVKVADETGEVRQILTKPRIKHVVHSALPLNRSLCTVVSLFRRLVWEKTDGGL